MEGRETTDDICDDADETAADTDIGGSAAPNC
jgi:hypothetical protein